MASLTQPFRFGQFNVEDDSPKSLQLCLNDIEKLLSYMMKEKLKIP